VTSIVPSFNYPVPTLNHDKLVPYIDFPIIFNAIKTNEPFYVDGEFLWVCSDTSATLHKWNGFSWTEVSSYTNPDIIEGRGFFSVTTTVAGYCTISELRTNFMVSDIRFGR
jgi:hypothetical protein